MTQLALAALVLGGVALVGLGGWWFSPYQVTLRALRAAPRVSVAQAREGELVRIIGTMRPGARTLVAPLSGRACSAFVCEVDVRVSNGKSTSWRNLIREAREGDLVVEDETGRALVRGPVETAIVLDHHQTSGTFDDATPALEAYLARHGQKSTDFFGFNKGMRYREGVLEPGETIAVLGRAQWEDDPEPGAAQPTAQGGYRETTRRKRLVLVPGELPAVRASDDPAALT